MNADRREMLAQNHIVASFLKTSPNITRGIILNTHSYSVVWKHIGGDIPYKFVVGEDFELLTNKRLDFLGYEHRGGL